MSEFYTYVGVLGNKILYRGYRDGKPVMGKVDYKPTLYTPSKKNSPVLKGRQYEDQWTSLYDELPLEPIKFADIKEAKDFVKQYKDVSGFQVHGMDKWNYQFINEHFKGDIEYDVSMCNIMTFDIEVITPDGSFPDIQAATAPIVLISLYSTKTEKTIVLGIKSYVPTPDDSFEYMLFSTEREMLLYFIHYISTTNPDIWTGWNTETFDIPYMVNRISRVLDSDHVKKLSPFGYIREKNVIIQGREIQTFELYGVVSLDYLELYQTLPQPRQGPFDMGYVAQQEKLTAQKLDLPGESFKDNYDNHFQTFVQYSAVDSIVIKELDEKLKLIDIVFSLAYLYRCNLADTFRTVLPWEIFIFNYLAERKIAVPPRKQNLDAGFEGAWVKEPRPGMYGWVMSFDFAGLYPHVAIQWNISPDTLIQDYEPLTVNDFLNKTPAARDAQAFALANNLTLAANGTMYRKDKLGFLADLMRMTIDGRKDVKKLMLKKEQEYQDTHDEALQNVISALNNRQIAFKIAGNSGYGALGNKGFLYFDSRVAEAITLTGQFSDRHLVDAFNLKLNEIMKTGTIDYVIMGDTDSVYVNCQPIVDKFCAGFNEDQIVSFLDKFGATVLQKVVQESIDEIYESSNGYRKVMNSKREAIASKTLVRKKKNYAMKVHNSEGVTYNPPKMKVLGLEIVRSTTPQWCRKKLKECLQMMFDKPELELRAYYAKLYAEFCTLTVEEIATPKGISDIDKWMGSNGLYIKGVPMHVRGSILYNYHTKPFEKFPALANGDKIKYVYLKKPNPINENVISFGKKLPVELGLHKYIDYEVQFEKAFKEPLKSLTDAAGWNLEDVSTLDDFFG